MVPETSEIQITVGDADVTDRVVFAQTNFQSVAGAQPGSCQVTLRSLSKTSGWGSTGPAHGFALDAFVPETHRINIDSFVPGRDLIALWVNGKRMWWGYLFIIEQGYVFPASAEPKVVLHGVDLNILFDKLVLYNHAHPTWYPDGGGTYKREKVVGSDGKVAGYVVTVPVNTTDKSYIQTMMKDFDIGLVSPLIKYGQTAPHDCKINVVSTINTGDVNANWTPPGPGTTMRAFFQDVSNNIIRSQPGSSIWYIDPDAYIVWAEQDSTAGYAPWPVGDTNQDNIVPVKSLSVTTDVSRLKNDVLVFTGTLDPTPQSTQEFLLYVHKINQPSVNLFGRFQWSEVMGSDWLAGMINARANKVLAQEGTPAMKADFTVYRPGLYPGQIVTIFSDSHSFLVYDPTFGLQTLDNVKMPIRSIDMTFPTPNVVEFRASCSFDTQDPWGLLLALKRPSTRGLVQPNFTIIDLTRGTKTSVVASPMTLVKEYPARGSSTPSGINYQCTYAYIRDSLTVVVAGLRQTSVPEPESGVVGFLETDPDKGQFMLASGTSGKVYVEYHVWHNLG